MSYDDLYNEAKNGGDLEELGISDFKFAESGQLLVGKLIEIKQVEAKKTKTKINVYTFDTDTGAVKTMLGSAFDKMTGSQLVVDDVYCIEYTGKRDIGRGQSMNTYKVFHVGRQKGIGYDE